MAGGSVTETSDFFGMWRSIHFTADFISSTEEVSQDVYLSFPYSSKPDKVQFLEWFNHSTSLTEVRISEEHNRSGVFGDCLQL